MDAFKKIQDEVAYLRTNESKDFAINALDVHQFVIQLVIALNHNSAEALYSVRWEGQLVTVSCRYRRENT